MRSLVQPRGVDYEGFPEARSVALSAIILLQLPHRVLRLGMSGLKDSGEPEFLSIHFLLTDNPQTVRAS